MGYLDSHNSKWRCLITRLKSQEIPETDQIHEVSSRPGLHEP